MTDKSEGRFTVLVLCILSENVIFGWLVVWGLTAI